MAGHQTAADRRQVGKKLSEGFLTYSDAKYRLILTRIRNYLMSRFAGEIHDLETLKRILSANVSDGKPFITSAQAKDLAKKAGVRDSSDADFFWNRLSASTGVPSEPTVEITRLATLLHARSPNAAGSHPAAAELGATLAIDRFLQEYTEVIERKFSEVERTAANRLENLLRENQILKTQLRQAQEAAQAPSASSESDALDREKMSKMQKALVMARERIQSLEASESELHGSVAQKEAENERLRSLSLQLKTKVDEQDLKIQQTVDIAKKRVTKLAEEIRDLRAERDDYRKQLGLPPAPAPQQQREILSRTMTSPNVVGAHVSTGPTSPRAASTSSTSAGTCATCSQLILDKFYTKTKNRIYHTDCFKCVKCGKSIPEGKFGEDPTDGKPRCASCWTSAKTPKCKACSDPITDTLVEALGFNYHQGCFKCTSCHTPFENTFFHLDGIPYCESCLAKH
eukprot:TRINITY_DN5630_c0_g1_i1.p1 TRINITY_DN5630_c0_g1~~TRINITY_DN5630_c0_g1_i1.p1  ORF type:complete len:457 (+),score=42.39 TRINITY_DN5630_c0_g1_i1:113-1483(+)